MANFQRTKFYAYKKLGASQKSKRKYRRATGRHNKTRQKWRSRPPMVEIGYKNRVKTRGLINDKTPIMVFNLADLKKVNKTNIVILGNIGNRKKLEIAREALNKKIEIYNLNINKFIKIMDRKMKNNKKIDNAEKKDEKLNVEESKR